MELLDDSGCSKGSGRFLLLRRPMTNKFCMVREESAGDKIRAKQRFVTLT